MGGAEREQEEEDEDDAADQTAIPLLRPLTWDELQLGHVRLRGVGL